MADYENNVATKEKEEQEPQLKEEEPEQNPVYAEVPEERKLSRVSLDRRSNKSSTLYEEEMNEVAVEEEPHDYGNAPMPVALPARQSRSEIPSVHKQQSTTLLKTAVNLQDRDPHNLQKAIIVNFEDIIAEPQGTHSFNTVWETSYTVYFYTKFWLYRILSLVFGVPCAVLWGIYFGITAFLGVWWIMPAIKAISIQIRYIGKLYSIIIHTFVDPIFESFGLWFSRIKVNMIHKN